jgi:lambda family phage portal protein
VSVISKIRDYFRRPIVITQRAGNGISANYTPRHTEYGSGAKFPGGLSRGASINIHNHFTLRQHARDAMYDSVEARSLIESIVDSVVDSGLHLKPVPDSDTLGITPEAAEQWAEKVADAFHLWAKSKKSHRPRVNNFYQNQRLYQLFQQRDNDIFVRFYYGRDKDIFNPLQIDFLDPNQIRGYDYTSNYMQAPGDDGIERDSAGRETGYKIWYVDQSGKYSHQTVPAIGEKSGRVFMLHGFNPEYAGQGRGYPRISHLIEEFEHLTDFKKSVIQKAINQASFIAVIENEQQDASQPLEGRSAGPIKQYGAYPTPDESASGVTETLPVVSWDAQPEATITQPGSNLVGNLRRGDKWKNLQDTSPSANYDAFVTSFFSSICASTGMSMEVVLKRFNNNYSASRATLILCWRVANIWRDEMAADFLDPVYEMWLSEEIASGRISAPGWSDYRLRAAWLNCEWSGSPMPSIDPSKMADADRAYVEMGAQTLDDVARNYNGSSGKANRAKNARQYMDLPAPPWPRAPIVENPDDVEDNKNG